MSIDHSSRSVRTDTPDSAMSNGSEVLGDNEDDFQEILSEVTSIKTAYNNAEVSVSAESMEGIVEVDSESDLKRKKKLQVLHEHVVRMSQAYSKLLDSNRKQSLENSNHLAQLQSRLDSAEERAQKAEESAANEGRSKEECREDLQSVLLWLTNGHSCPPPELKTSSIPDIVCCGEEYRGQLSTALSELTAKDQHILQLEENISNLESQLADKEKRAREERQHVEKDISELKSKLYSTEESRERLGQELSALKTKEEQLVKAISILKEKVEPLQNEADLKGKDLQVVREALGEEQNKMSSLEREYRDQEREWNDKLEEQALLKEGLQAKLEEQNAALAKLLGEREELQGKVKRSVEELNHLKRTIQEQNCARGVIEGELSAQEGLTKDLLQKKDKADKMIAALRNQVAEREALLKSLMRSLHGLSQQVGGIKEGDSPDDVIQKHADELEDSLSEVFEDIENLRKKWIETNRAVLEGESTLEGLRETQQSLNDEIDSLRRRTADLDLLLRDKNDEAAVLQGTIQQLQSDLACCRGNYDRVIEEKNLVEQELSGLHDNTLEQCKFLQEQLNRREQTLEDLTQQQEGLQEEYTKCCQDISTKQRAIQTLEDVLREKGEEIRVLTCELETASVDKESLQEDLQRCKVLVDSLHKEMVQKESDNLQDVKVITSDYESLQNEYAAVQDMLQEREKLMEDLRSSTKHLEKKRKKAESEVARHRDTINSLEDKLNEAQTNFDHLKSQLFERDRELQAVRQEAISSSESMNDKIKSILLELESLRLTKDSELSAVQMEYDGLAQNIKFLEDVVSSKNQEIQALHLKMADLEDELSTTKLHYQPYEGQVEELEHTVDGLKDQVTEKASEVERQRAELVHLQSANRRTKADLEKFEKAHQDLQTLLNQLQSFPRQWSVLGKDITNTQLKSKLEGLEHVFADMKCDQTQLEDKVKSLERALDKERFQHNHLQDLFMSEKKKLSHTEGCLAKSEENGRNLRERLKDEKEKQGMLMEQYTSLQQNNYQLEERENQLKQRLNEVRARLLAVEDEKEQEHISVERLREELGKCKSLVAQLKDSNSDLSAQLRQAQKQVSGQWDELQRERIEAHRQLEAAQKCTQLELELAEEKLEVQRVHGNLLREREDHCNTREEAARLAEGLMDMKSRLAKLIKDNCELQLEVSDSQVSDVKELDRIASVLNGAQTKFNAYVLEIKHLKGEVEKTKDFSGEAEEEVERLKNSLASAQKAHLITQKELHSTKSSLTRSQDLAKKLQEDCDAMANQVSLWTREQRMSQENFAERIRVLEKEIATLRADKQTLERQNGTMEVANKKLQTQLEWAKTVNKSSPPHTRRSNAVTHVQATLDLSIKHDQKNGNGDGTTVVNGNDTSDSTLQTQSQYAAALQKGLCGPKTQTSPPPTINLKSGREDMDKLYWMTRANQLALQLQQCTEFYSEKVRLLASEMECDKTTNK